MTDYREQYDKALADKHRLMGQLQVLSDALKETQRQLELQRTMNDALINANEELREQRRDEGRGFEWVTPPDGRTAHVEIEDAYELVTGEADGIEDFAYEHAQQFAEWAYGKGGGCPAGCRLSYKGGE